MAKVKPVSVPITAVNQFSKPFKDLNKSLKRAKAPLKQLQGQFNATSLKMAAMTKRMKKVSQSAKAMGQSLSLKVTAPILGVGAAALKMSIDVDEAFDIIAIGTGETGKSLDSLHDSFETVAKDSPNDIKDVATAIADLNTRLGLTGKPLEELADKTLKVSRLTGEAIGPVIAKMTKAMNDAGEAGGSPSEMMDRLFLASQKTGIGMGQLSEQMFKFGSPMRALGFDVDTTTALLGSFEKAGVNTDLVMGSLRIALGKMARAGVKDVGQGLKKAISTIKEAGTTGEAMSIALEVFGARAGPDMAAAIREGRFEVSQLVEDLKKSSGSINRDCCSS